MKKITLNFPLLYLNEMEEFVKSGVYKSRTHLLQVAFTEFIEREKAFIEYLKTKPSKFYQKIVTLNIEEDLYEEIQSLIGHGEEFSYVSRAELGRMVLRDFLIKEKSFQEFLKNKAALPLEESKLKEIIETITHKGKKWRLLPPGFEYV